MEVIINVSDYCVTFFLHDNCKHKGTANIFESVGPKRVLVEIMHTM